MATVAFVLSIIIKLALIVLGTIYISLVARRYATARSLETPKFQLEQLGRSIEQFLVWGGVKLLDLAIRMMRPVWQTLLEASADVGEWVVSREHR
jgi:hypothetical protein